MSILQSNLVEPVPGVGLGPGLESDSAPSQLGVAVVLVARSRADRRFGENCVLLLRIIEPGQAHQ